MKNIWKAALVALICCLACGQANAQFRWGIKAGVNINSLHPSNFKANFDKDNGCGFTGGLMTEFTVPVIGLCFDASLMYTRMQASGTLLEPDPEALAPEREAVNPAKNFLEIPINIKYKFPVPIVQPYLFTGPSFAFKLGGSDGVFKSKAFQCAWNIGIGAEIFSHLQIGASYGFGINNIMKDLHIVDNPSDQIKLKNNYWTITAAYLF